MAASTKLIADMKTAIANGPSSVTLANAIAAGGPIMDYVGGCGLVLLKLEEAYELLAASGVGTYPKALLATTDSSTDATNLALLQKVAAVINNAGGLLSTQTITDVGTVITNGPSAATLANASAAGGAIMDYPGNVGLLQLKLKEAHDLLSAGTSGNQTIKGLISVTDAGTDATNLALLQNIELALS